MLQLLPNNTNIDFVGKRKIWIGISSLAMIACLVLLFTKGLNFGIDFTGGAELQLKFNKTTPISDLRKMLEAAGFENLVIQELADKAMAEARGGTFRVKVQGDAADLQKINEKVLVVLKSKMQTTDFEIQRVDVVGPQAGSALRKSGFLSLFYALLCIMIYVAIRFDMRYSPGAVLALCHDAILTLGIFVVTQREFSLQIVAALLTIIGYSNNDTIIIYDRIRETIKLRPNETIEKNINRSINETLSRTILTSICTFFVTASLMVFGGGVITDFAFTMCIGIVVGTYSSIFIASPVLIVLMNFYRKKDAEAAAKKTLTYKDKTT